MSFVRNHPQGIVFKIFVLPRSSKNMIAGVHGDALKIKLTAPPVDGSANKMCIKYLAKQLNLSKSSLEIVSGQTSRTKQVLVHFSGAKASVKEQEHLKALVESLAS